MSELEPHYAQTPPDQRPNIQRNPVHVVLDNLRSAYNVGSIFRTSDAISILKSRVRKRLLLLPEQKDIFMHGRICGYSGRTW